MDGLGCKILREQHFLIQAKLLAENPSLAIPPPKLVSPKKKVPLCCNECFFANVLKSFNISFMLNTKHLILRLHVLNVERSFRQTLWKGTLLNTRRLKSRQKHQGLPLTRLFNAHLSILHCSFPGTCWWKDPLFSMWKNASKECNEATSHETRNHRPGIESITQI